MSHQTKINTNKALIKRSAWLICTLGALFYCYEYFLRITPSVMVPQLMTAFHIDATTLGTMVGLYYWIYTPMQLPVGITMDRYGPRRLLIFASLVCALGVFLFNSPHYIIIASLGRILIGFGSAFAFVGVLKLASMWLPPSRFALVTGLTMALAMTGAMLGDVLVTKFVALSGWQAAFKFSIITGLILAAVIGLVIPDESPQVIEHAEQFTNTYAELWRVTGQLLKNPVIWLNGLVGCFLYMSLSIFAELWGPQYLHVAHHLTEQQATNTTIIVFLAWAIGSPIIGAVSTNLRRALHCLLLGSLFTAIFAGITLYFTSIHGLMLYTCVFVFAIASSTQILVFPIAKSLVKKEMSGTAVAITNLLVMLGGAVFQPAVGKLLDHHWEGAMVNGIRAYSPHAYTISLSILVIGAMISFVLVLLIKAKLKARNQLY